MLGITRGGGGKAGNGDDDGVAGGDGDHISVCNNGMKGGRCRQLPFFVSHSMQLSKHVILASRIYNNEILSYAWSTHIDSANHQRHHLFYMLFSFCCV